MEKINKGITFFLIIFFILSFLPVKMREAGGVLSLSPSGGTFYLGSTFDVSIFVDTGGDNVNAFQIDLKFPTDKLQVAEPFIGKSIITVLSVPPSYSNIKGTISLQGGVPHPGIKTSAGLILTITFRAKEPGMASIYFLNSSKVLLDDGLGTNILASTVGATYNLSIPPPEGPLISSPTHPDQTKWYKNSNPTFLWQKEEGVTGFSYILSKDPTTIPDNKSEGKDNSISYEKIADGLWYFHLKAKKGGNWGGISTFLIKIDTAPPADFIPESESPLRTSNHQPIISFFTTDSASGIDHYEIKVINVGKAGEETDVYFFTEETSPYKLPKIELGTYEIIVRAFDRAGNWKDGKIRMSIVSPFISFIKDKGIEIMGVLISWPIVFLILALILGLLGFLIYRRKKEEKETQKKIKDNLDNIKERFSQELFQLDDKIKKDMTKREEIKQDLESLKDVEKGEMPGSKT